MDMIPPGSATAYQSTGMVAQRVTDPGTTAAEGMSESSKESLALSRTLPKKGRTRTVSAARPPSGKREMPNRAGPHVARAPSAGGAISISRALIRKRTAPAVPVRTTTQAAVDTVEGHLAALLAQQKPDHDYFQDPRTY